MAKKQVQPRSTSWKAEHFIHFEKGKTWYVIFTIVMLLIVAGALLYKQWMLAGVILAAMLAIYSFAKEKPAERKFRIDSTGVQVGNRRYNYDQLKSFWIAVTPESKLLYLQSIHRVVTPIMINLGDTDEGKVKAILKQHLPEEMRSEILSDRINRWLRF
jgi:hypothetical protein